MTNTTYQPNIVERDDLQNRFTYHPPIKDQANRYELIREDAKAFGSLIITYCPPSRERSLALTKLEECVMWANASIARNESLTSNTEAENNG